jgi:hypothetical protein
MASRLSPTRGAVSELSVHFDHDLGASGVLAARSDADHLVQQILDRISDPAVREALDRLVGELSTKHSTVYELLNRMDRNKDGVLSRDEIRRGLAGMGVRLTTWELDSVMRTFDKDRNGKVDYVEFYTVLTNHRGNYFQVAAARPRGFVVLFSRRSSVVQFDRRTFANLSAAETQRLADNYQAVARMHDQVDARLDALDRDYVPVYLKGLSGDSLIFFSQDEANTVARQVLELAIVKIRQGSVGLIPCEASVASAHAEFALEFRLPESDKTVGSPTLSASGLATYRASLAFFSTHYSTDLFNIVVSELSCRVVG